MNFSIFARTKSKKNEKVSKFSVRKKRFRLYMYIARQTLVITASTTPLFGLVDSGTLTGQSSTVQQRHIGCDKKNCFVWSYNYDTMHNAYHRIQQQSDQNAYFSRWSFLKIDKIVGFALLSKLTSAEQFAIRQSHTIEPIKTRLFKGLS